MSEDFERQSLPWMSTGFDWEAVAAAAGAFLAALLLGWIWAPLFWIGFAAMAIALAAGRWARRRNAWRCPPRSLISTIARRSIGTGRGR
jgi:phosphatidylserine decarboxylase